MSELDVSWLEEKLVARSRRNAVEAVLSADETPALAKGENYASQILRTRVEVRLGSGERTCLSLMIKRALPLQNLPQEMLKEMEIFFNGEYDVYSNVLPQIEKILKESGELSSRFWAECVAFKPNKEIYFTDLKEAGYRLAGLRRGGYDEEHCRLALRTLAKLHAAGAEAVARGLVDTAAFPQYFMIRDSDMSRKMLVDAFNNFIDVIRKNWSPQWSAMADRLEKFKDTCHDSIISTGKLDPSRFNVINHGDYWVNNVMFKYSYDNRPISLRMVDFQATHYNSFGFDLVYLLNTSINRENLGEEVIEKLLKEYLHVLHATLQQVGSSVACPSWADLKQELDRLLPIALNVNVVIRPIVMTSCQEHVIDMSSMSEGELFGQKTRVLYTNPVYERIMKMQLKHFFPEVTAPETID